jgi:hypothetical protein
MFAVQGQPGEKCYREFISKNRPGTVVHVCNLIYVVEVG